MIAAANFGINVLIRHGGVYLYKKDPFWGSTDGRVGRSCVYVRVYPFHKHVHGNHIMTAFGDYYVCIAL